MKMLPTLFIVWLISLGAFAGARPADYMVCKAELTREIPKNPSQSVTIASMSLPFDEGAIGKSTVGAPYKGNEYTLHAYANQTIALVANNANAIVALDLSEQMANLNKGVAADAVIKSSAKVSLNSTDTAQIICTAESLKRSLLRLLDNQQWQDILSSLRELELREVQPSELEKSHD